MIYKVRVKALNVNQQPPAIELPTSTNRIIKGLRDIAEGPGEVFGARWEFECPSLWPA